MILGEDPKHVSNSTELDMLCTGWSRYCNTLHKQNIWCEHKQSKHVWPGTKCDFSIGVFNCSTCLKQVRINTSGVVKQTPLAGLC